MHLYPFAAVFKFGAGLITATAYVLLLFLFVYCFGFVLMEKLSVSATSIEQDEKHLVF